MQINRIVTTKASREVGTANKGIQIEKYASLIDYE